MFDSSRGEGDLVIADAFGRFRGGFVCRRLCPQCNNRAGHSEHQLVQCTPEGFRLRVLDPPRQRGERGRGWTAAQGARKPWFTIDWPDHPEFVRPSREDSSVFERFDQLVFRSVHQEWRYVELDPRMSLQQLLGRVAKQEADLSGDLFYHTSVPNAVAYDRLFRAAWPTTAITCDTTYDLTKEQTVVHLHFEGNDHTFRAVAKTAFHYYLETAGGGACGNEIEFQQIRDFIMNGGDPAPFVEQRILFAPSERKQAGHLLMGSELDGWAAVAVALCVLPEERKEASYVVALGRIPPACASHDRAWGHVYLFDDRVRSAGYAGRVESLTVVA